MLVQDTRNLTDDLNRFIILLYSYYEEGKGLSVILDGKHRSQIFFIVLFVI